MGPRTSLEGPFSKTQKSSSVSAIGAREITQWRSFNKRECKRKNSKDVETVKRLPALFASNFAINVAMHSVRSVLCQSKSALCVFYGFVDMECNNMAMYSSVEAVIVDEFVNLCKIICKKFTFLTF